MVLSISFENTESPHSAFSDPTSTGAPWGFFCLHFLWCSVVLIVASEKPECGDSALSDTSLKTRPFAAPVSPAKPSALQVIPPTRHTASSVCCHQGGDCGVSRPGPADWRTASSIRLSGSWTPSRPCPPSPLLPHAPLNSDTTTPTPPPAPHIPRTFHPPPHLQTVTRTSHFVQHWTDHYLIQHWLQTTSSDSLIKDCSLSSYHFNRLISSFCTTLIISAQFCLFNWFALYLPCALCYFIYLFFSTMSSFVYLYSLYVHMFKLYLSVFERLLSVFNVNCMHQGSESYAISILCMYVLYMWQNWQ